MQNVCEILLIHILSRVESFFTNYNVAMAKKTGYCFFCIAVSQNM